MRCQPCVLALLLVPVIFDCCIQQVTDTGTFTTCWSVSVVYIQLAVLHGKSATLHQAAQLLMSDLSECVLAGHAARQARYAF